MGAIADTLPFPVSEPFATEMETHRRELTGYCYRMLGAGSEAEDAVQETFLRAWRGRGGFEGRATLRSWLYRIATNVCLDMPQRPQRRARPMDLVSPTSTEAAVLDPRPDSHWVQPVADARVLPDGGDPAELTRLRESIRLAFVAALQFLPPRQRVVLILREVLHWQASEVATLLETTTASVNSALQRARAAMQSHLPDQRAEWSAGEPSAAERELLGQFIAAHERFDAEAALAIAARDIRVTMPPLPYCFDGREQLRPLLADAAAMGDWRLVPVRANRMPAAASYLRRPGDSQFRAFKLDVLRAEAGLIAEITTFNADLFPSFGLGPTL